MRQIILDTETTGLEPGEGHRIIEIGCIEIVNRRITGNTFHQYIQPERDIDAGAAAVHGITNEKLRDKPLFAAIVDDLLAFVRDAEVIIHNAPFDVGFLNAELGRLGSDYGKFNDHCRVTDTLALARKLHPGQKNSLDALCKRYSVDNSGRDLHGALLDSQLLAEVFLAMTGGQSALTFDSHETSGTNASRARIALRADRGKVRVIAASADELADHAGSLALVDKFSGGKTVWNKV